MRSHNIVGCEAVFDRGYEARERAFSPAHGSILVLPPAKRRMGILVAFITGVAATLITAAFLVTQR